MQNGDIVSGKITGIKDYGAFVQVDEYCGLIHISEFSDGFVRNINDIVAIGDVVSVEVSVPFAESGDTFEMYAVETLTNFEMLTDDIIRIEKP